MAIEATDENLNVLVDVFLDGYVSGSATTAYNIGNLELSESHQLAQDMGNQALRDRQAIEAIKANIRERLSGGEGQDRVIPVDKNIN